MSQFLWKGVYFTCIPHEIGILGIVKKVQPDAELKVFSEQWRADSTEQEHNAAECNTQNSPLALKVFGMKMTEK